MTEFPLVSIILPTYNRAHLLPQAINSVLSQTYQNWELIIWNDGSCDNTEDVIYQCSDNRIINFSSENHGKSYALNQALKHAKGFYVAFLDDDDTWAENKLSLQVNFLVEFPEIDMIFGNFININQETGNGISGFDQTAHVIEMLNKKQLTSQYYLITGNFLKAIAIDNFIAFDSILIRRNILDELGLFNENLRNAEDFEYWWRFGLTDRKVGFVNALVMNRFKYIDSLSSQSIKSIDNYIKSLDACSNLSKIKQKKDTIKYLIPAYRNAFQNKIIAYGALGDKEKAINAFIDSLKYGFRPGSLKLIVNALLK